jgi:hypothetical protein
MRMWVLSCMNACVAVTVWKRRSAFGSLIFKKLLTAIRAVGLTVDSICLAVNGVSSGTHNGLVSLVLVALKGGATKYRIYEGVFGEE